MTEDRVRGTDRHGYSATPVLGERSGRSLTTTERRRERPTEGSRDETDRRRGSQGSSPADLSSTAYSGSPWVWDLLNPWAPVYL